MLSLQNNLKELPQVGVTTLHRSVGSAASMRGDNFYMEEEVWVNVKGSKFTEVSSLGRFRTSFFKKGVTICKQHISKTGYLALRINGKTQRAHRIIATAFIPNPLNLPQVNHIDGNKLNNNFNNLEWVSNKQNSEHAWKNGLIKRQFGEKTSKAILTNEDAINIVNSNSTDKEIAILYNVHDTTINSIRCGKNWSDITNVKRKFKKKVNPITVINIFNSKYNDDETASIFGVSRQYVNSIKIGRLYSEITGKEYIKKQKTPTRVTPEIVIGVKSMSNLKLKDSMKEFNITESVVVKIRAGKYDSLISKK